MKLANKVAHNYLTAFYNSTLEVGIHVVQVFKNPDSEELKECATQGSYYTARGFILNSTGDLFIWTSDLNGYMQIEHAKVLKKMSMMSKPFIPIIIDIKTKNVEFSDFMYERSSLYKDVKDPTEIIRDNPHIKELGLKVVT